MPMPLCFRKSCVFLLLSLVGIGSTFALSADPLQNGSKMGMLKASHPLDPLTMQEIQTAVSVVKQRPDLSKTVLFPYVYLQEPPKTEVLNYKPGLAFSRKAFVSVLEEEKNAVYEAVVDLNQKKILSWVKIEKGQPPFMDMEQTEEVNQIIKSDPRWLKAMHDRGIENTDELIINTWTPGLFLPPTIDEKKRLIRFLTYWKGPYDNMFSNPVEGVVGIFDLNAHQVLDIMDSGIVPLAKINADYDAQTIGPDKHSLKPLKVVQPEGVSFTLSGNEVSWYRWKFRFFIHPREGLVIHQVTYDGRPILYRAGISEIVVPYGDPSPAWRWRIPMDMGDYAIGNCYSPILLGKDVPENAVLCEGVLADNLGNPVVVKGIAAIYEEDAGLLWRHQNPQTDVTNSHRSRALVIQFFSLLDNYDYAFSWAFYPEGTLEPRIDLLGILLQKATAEKRATESCALVAPGVLAPSHQHFFCYRLNMGVDGTANSLCEVNFEPLPAQENPSGTGWTHKKTLLTSEKMAQRDLDMRSQRAWKVFNPTVTNALGEHTAYALVPAYNSFPYLQISSPPAQLAQLLKHQLWVTRYDPTQMYPAGNYPNQGPPGEGLPQWVMRNASLVNTDLVLWYVTGTTHLPHPEEWPVMLGKRVVPFKLHPAGFFSKNPVLDFGNEPARGQ